ncbi:hypothetical protein, partial [Arthrobacter sp.]|uniref:hypothetical protein n=1 Tax=Arthrobacter sp. TaxID=1667 RepID=UPI002811150F
PSSQQAEAAASLSVAAQTVMVSSMSIPLDRLFLPLHSRKGRRGEPSPNKTPAGYCTSHFAAVEFVEAFR